VARRVSGRPRVRAALGARASKARQLADFGALSLPLLIPLPDHSEFMMYGNDVMDLTILGLRSM